MISDEDIKKIKALSRLEFDQKEEVNFKKDFEAILGYFGKIKEVSVESVSETSHVPEIVSVAREDKEPSEPYEDTALLVDAAPEKEDGRVKVKAILQRE